MFCSESREQSTYYKHCMMATIEVYVCCTVKIYKYKPPQKFKMGARAQSAGAGSALICIRIN